MNIHSFSHSRINQMNNQWQWFENWLAKNAPEVVNNLNDGCSLEQLAEVENETGLKMPQSFKDFYLLHNGQRDEDYFGLFYGVSLLPLNKIIGKWQGWKEIAEEIRYMIYTSEVSGDFTI